MSRTVVITGKTFEHRDTLKAMGARFNGTDKSWSIANPTDADIDRIAALALAGVRHTIVGVDLAAPTASAAIEGGTMFIGNDRTYFNAFLRKDPKTFAGFERLSDMSNYIRAIPSDIRNDTGYGGRNDGWATGYERETFTGSRSMDHALSLADNGWHSGVTLANEALAILHADHAVRRQREYNVAGGRVSVGRMLAGNPLHMVQRTRQPSKKVITLYVEAVMSHKIKAENAIIRAASVAAICDALESAGYSCEIVGTMMFRTRRAPYEKPICQITTKLKNAGDALNLNDLVFALGHPSYLRRMGFAVFAVNPALSFEFKSMGVIDDAFRGEMEPGSFYIRQLLEHKQPKDGSFADKVRAIFPTVVPKNFPVQLND